MERWRLVTTWGAEPAFNMGLDEALLASSECAPTLRLYTWSPDTLSIGYFQKLEDVRGHERAGAIVRRITGGGAIHHVHELTFSIATSLDHPIYRGPVGDSYRRVHAAIATALATFGVTAVERGADALESDRDDTGMCFHGSTPLDLAWSGRKGVGSAQRRRGRRVLHHGSIKIGSSVLEGDIATIRAIAPGADAHAVGAALVDALARSFDLSFERDVPDAVERQEARRLGARYVDRDFVRSR